MRNPAIYITAALLLASACNKAVMEPQRMGAISLALSSDKEVMVETKADAVDCSGFLVDIYGTTFLGQDYASEQYVYSEMPDAVVIPYGYYHVSAQSCTSDAAEDGYGKVRYQGVSDQVDVLSQTPSAVTVNCKMVNGKVTIIIDDSFLEDFEDVTAELTATRTVELTSAQANAPTEVYFNTPAEGVQLIYTVYGTVKASGQRLKYSNTASPMNLMPAKWAKITIKSNHNGLIGPDVTVDGNMGSDSFTEVIDPETGDTILDGTAGLPSILVDTQIDDATVIDCIIDIY
jgi:hypothetical protein